MDELRLDLDRPIGTFALSGEEAAIRLRAKQRTIRRSAIELVRGLGFTGASVREEARKLEASMLGGEPYDWQAVNPAKLAPVAEEQLQRIPPPTRWRLPFAGRARSREPFARRPPRCSRSQRGTTRGFRSRSRSCSRARSPGGGDPPRSADDDSEHDDVVRAAEVAG